MPETLKKTNLNNLSVGQHVNLERAMGGHSRFGGHFVQGHVDTTATIKSVTPEGNSLVFRFSVPDAHLMSYIIPKGYVCLDGISLTVVDVCDHDHSFSICMIAYTQTKVTLSKRKVGETVNLEVDLLGKYVEKMIIGMVQGGNNPIDNAENEGQRGSLSHMLESRIDRILDKKLARKD
jgi:riboflavin synthase